MTVHAKTSSFHCLITLVVCLFQGIPPANLPKVVGESVESTLLIKMLTILRNFYVRYVCPLDSLFKVKEQYRNRRIFLLFRDGLPIFTEMKYISKMKRFSMTLMFLSNDEKNGERFKTVLAYMKYAERVSTGCLEP